MVPIGFSLASRSNYTRNIITKAMANEYVKIRHTRDIIGTEICGSIKNVIAIASGMLDGMGYPISTSTMFITESLHDIKALIKALGGNKKTILSFAGFGDILLTCTSTKSRNYTLGKLIGEGKSKEEINKDIFYEVDYIKGASICENRILASLLYINVYNNLLPSPFFTTFGAGHPIFISIISGFDFSHTILVALTISSMFPPNN